MKTIVCWSTLLQYAKDLAQAEKSKDEVLIARAKQRHDDYLELCKQADEMCLGMSRHQAGF